MDRRTAATLLGVDADATPKQVRQAFERRARLVHPDRVVGSERDRATASALMGDLNHARDVLLGRAPANSHATGEAGAARERAAAAADRTAAAGDRATAAAQRRAAQWAAGLAQVAALERRERSAFWWRNVAIWSLLPAFFVGLVVASAAPGTQLVGLAVAVAPGVVAWFKHRLMRQVQVMVRQVRAELLVAGSGGG